MAERYTRKRYLQDIGQSFGPVVTDKSAISRAQTNLTQSVSGSIEVMKKFAIGQAEQQAQRRAAKRAQETDAQEIIANTEEGFLTLEDELSRKYAFVNLKNKTLDEISLEAEQIEADAIAENLDSTTYQAQLKNLVQTKLKNLRDNGLNSPTLELEIQESVAGGIRSRVTQYASNRITTTQKAHNTAIQTDILNAAANYGRFNTEVDIQKFNDVMESNKEFIASQQGLQNKITLTINLNTAKRFQAQAKMFVSNRPTPLQLKKFEDGLNEFVNTLPTNPNTDVLAIVRDAQNTINIYKGKDVFAASDLAETRGTKNFSDRQKDETKKYSANVTGVYNMLDSLVVRGVELSEDMLNDMVTIITDVATGPVNLQDGFKYKDSMRAYYLERKNQFNLDEAGFFARENDMPEQMVFGGEINVNTLTMRLQTGYSVISQKDADDFVSALNEKKPEELFNYVTKFINTGGPQVEDILYRDLMTKLPTDKRKLVRSFVIAREVNKVSTENDYVTQIGAGIDFDATNKLSTDEKNARSDAFDAALEQALPPGVFYGADRPTFKTAIKDAVDLYFKGELGATPISGVSEDEILKIVNLFAGNDDSQGERTNGFIGNYYLDQVSVPPNARINGQDIEDWKNYVTNSTLGLYQYRMTSDFTFVNDGTQPQGYALMATDQYIAGRGAGKDRVALTANKLMENFTFRNAQASDFFADKLPVNVSGYAVAVDGQGNILRFDDNMPILYNIEQGANEFAQLNIPAGTSTETEEAFTIRGVKATGVATVRGPVTKVLGDETQVSDRERIIRLRRVQ